MEEATYNFLNSSLLIIILTSIAFALGLWLGWILWRKSYSRSSGSLWHTGHPHPATSIAPMLNPTAYLNAIYISSQVNSMKKSEQGGELTEERNISGGGRDTADKIVESGAEKLDVEAKSAVEDIPAAWRDLSADISAGKARLDDTLGLVYSERPEHEDDLTALKGVAKVLNGKLNDFGVFTYRQIAGWNDSIIAEFSTRLSFKDRVKRDDWVGQAKALHKDKYGVDLD